MGGVSGFIFVLIGSIARLEECIYDGDGKRIQVTDSSNITIYIYSGLNVLYEETMNSAATYTYGPVGRMAKRTTINLETNTYYYHTDHVGSTRLVTDDSKTIVAHTVYHPFGEPYSADGSQDYSFTGKKQDATGLYYVSARYYDPELGRFLTRDPKKGINQYSYCYNNPLKYIDPDGCEPTRWIFTDTCMPPSETEMQHPHVIYWMGKTVTNDYRAYGYFCLVSGIFLAAMGGYAVLPAVSSYLSAQIASLATSLSAAGPKVAWAVMGILKRLASELAACAGTRSGQKIIDTILVVITSIIIEINEGNEEIGSIDIYDEEGNCMGVNIILKELNGRPIKGIVVLFNGEQYEWKWSGGIYYVRIDGSWVPITDEEWEPGEELPDELSEDEVLT